MKIIFSFLSLIIIINSFLIEGIYRIDDDLHFSTIELRKDKSFTFKYRGQSCWVWHDRNGFWEVIKDTLILKDNFTWKEDTFIVNESEAKRNNIKIQIVNELRKPITKVEVSFYYLNKNNHVQKKISDQNGEIFFNKPKVLLGKEKSKINIKVKSDNFENSFSTYLNKNSNEIDIIFNRNPKSEEKTRIEKYSLNRNNNELIALSTNSFDSKMKYIKE